MRLPALLDGVCSKQQSGQHRGARETKTGERMLETWTSKAGTGKKAPVRTRPCCSGTTSAHGTRERSQPPPANSKETKETVVETVSQNRQISSDEHDGNNMKNGAKFCEELDLSCWKGLRILPWSSPQHFRAKFPHCKGEAPSARVSCRVTVESWETHIL